MTTLPLEREAILPRIDGIKKNVARLQMLAKSPFDQFSQGDPYDLAQHHLRLALEGIFNISSHILSRLPGARAVEYKEMARKMAEHKIVPEEFSRRALIPMAGMRNILVHYYSDIEPEKLFEVVTKHTKDIEEFLSYVKEVVSHPETWNLTLS